MAKPVLNSLNTVAFNDSEPADPKFEHLIERVTARIHDGLPIDMQQLAAEHPDYADLIGELLPAIEMLARLGDVPAERAATNGQDQSQPTQHQQEHQLGDYRIIGELGRGGMGIVYEAEQISLGRRVALKVLPFAGMLDQQQLARFKNEARAAAMLHHKHIVPIHAVGSERGVHYYAMQLIEGQTLAQIIEQLRAQSKEQETGAKQSGAGSKYPRLPLGEGRDAGALESESRKSQAEIATRPVARVSTVPDMRSREYYRTVARLGIEAAEALDHAHQNGVLHRDIKPANLLVDNSGKLWITDFGLAQMEADAGMTMTGDLLGTLRYMSPEQALAKRVVVDHRSDMYSLGATLYELLTLQPAFGETDRSELLKQIAFNEPLALHQLDRHIPMDLETIVLKAMRKTPEQRYATANDLADDLQRFLDTKPIMAKPPTWREKVLKWSRRHPAAIWTFILFLSAITAISTGSAIVVSNAYTREAAERKRAEAERERSERNFDLARAPVRRLIDHAVMGAGDWHELTPTLRKQFSAYAIDFYKTALQQKSSDVPLLYETAVIYRSLAQLHYANKEFAQSETFLNESIKILDRLCEEYPGTTSYEYHLGLANYWFATRFRKDRPAEAEALLVKATSLYAGVIKKDSAPNQYFEEFDFCWRKLQTLRENRGELGNEWMEEVIATYHDVVMRDPENVVAHACLGDVLRDQNRREEAILAYREAIRRQPRMSSAHLALGDLLFAMDRHDESCTAFSEAIRIFPKDHQLRAHAGTRFAEMDRLSEAIEEYRAASTTAPKEAAYHANLSVLLGRKMLFDESLAVAQQAVRLAPDSSGAHEVLGRALHRKWLFDDAINEYGKAIHLNSTSTTARIDLAEALRQAGHPNKSIGECLQAIKFAPNVAVYHLTLGLARQDVGDSEEAISALREALRLEPAVAEYHARLANILYESELRKEAAEEYAVAIDAFRRQLRDDPDDADILQLYAWLLATCCASNLRDSELAMKLAVKAVDAAPQNPAAWSTLGVAHYRVGNWRAAKHSLLRASELRIEVNSTVLFLLAMAERQQGNHDAAEKWYLKGVDWLTQRPEIVAGEHHRFRAEAEELFEIATGAHREPTSADKPSEDTE